MISGFRVARGGAQEREGVTPDLTMLGKVIGGGLPAAAYAGPRDLMERIAPAGDVYQAGTLSGNPLATAAGLATLRLLDAAAYERLDALARTLADGPRGGGGRGRRAGPDRHAPGLVTLFFSERPVRDYEDAKALRPRPLRRVLPRDARPRRLPAAVAVRGLVPVARPHRRRRSSARWRPPRRR